MEQKGVIILLIFVRRTCTAYAFEFMQILFYKYYDHDGLRSPVRSPNSPSLHCTCLSTEVKKPAPGVKKLAGCCCRVKKPDPLLSACFLNAGWLPVYFNTIY